MTRAVLLIVRSTRGSPHTPQVRSWERSNGAARLEISAGKAMHPELGELVPLGLPYGPKPRLILAHLNSEVLRPA